MWYICTMEYYTANKMKFCHLQQTWIDLEATVLSEIRKTKKDKQHMISRYMWNKNKINKLVNITKKKQTYTYREQTSGSQWGESRGEGQYKGRG